MTSHSWISTSVRYQGALRSRSAGGRKSQIFKTILTWIVPRMEVLTSAHELSARSEISTCPYPWPMLTSMANIHLPMLQHYLSLSATRNRLQPPMTLIHRQDLPARSASQFSKSHPYHLFPPPANWKMSRLLLSRNQNHPYHSYTSTRTRQKMKRGHNPLRPLVVLQNACHSHQGRTTRPTDQHQLLRRRCLCSKPPHQIPTLGRRVPSTWPSMVKLTAVSIASDEVVRRESTESWPITLKSLL